MGRVSVLVHPQPIVTRNQVVAATAGTASPALLKKEMKKEKKKSMK